MTDIELVQSKEMVSEDTNTESPTPKRRGRKPKVEDAPKSNEVIKQSNVEPATTSEIAKSAEDVKPAKAPKRYAFTRSGVTLYRSPNSETHVGTVTGIMELLGEEINGYLPVSVTIPEYGRYKGYILKSQLMKYCTFS